MRVNPDDDSVLARLWDDAFPGIDDETQACLIADSSIFFIEWDDVEKIIQPVDRELVALRSLGRVAQEHHWPSEKEAFCVGCRRPWPCPEGAALAPLVREEPNDDG